MDRRKYFCTCIVGVQFFKSLRVEIAVHLRLLVIVDAISTLVNIFLMNRTLITTTTSSAALGKISYMTTRICHIFNNSPVPTNYLGQPLLEVLRKGQLASFSRTNAICMYMNKYVVYYYFHLIKLLMTFFQFTNTKLSNTALQ